MKKILLGTSALIAAVAVSAPANAADPIQLSIGGYMNQWFGYGDSGDTPDTIDVAFKNDTEIHFKGSTTLDNGITFGVVVELEGEQDGDQIDEAYMTISGGFGDIRLGNEDGAMDLTTSTSEVGPVVANDGDSAVWVAGATAADALITLSSDASKIRYTTPNFGGFQAAVSYAPSGGEDTLKDSAARSDNAADGGSALNHITEVMAKYAGDFGSFNMGVGVSYGYASSEDNIVYGSGTTATVNFQTEDYHVVNFGAEVGVGPVTVSGNYSNVLSGTVAASGATNETSAEGYGYAVAAKYEQGPVAVSLGYAYDEREGDTSVASEDENHTVSFGAEYDFGAGVSWGSSIGWTAHYEESANGTRDGMFAVTGFKVSF